MKLPENIAIINIPGQAEVDAVAKYFKHPSGYFCKSVSYARCLGGRVASFGPMDIFPEYSAPHITMEYDLFEGLVELKVVNDNEPIIDEEVILDCLWAMPVGANAAEGDGCIELFGLGEEVSQQLTELDDKKIRIKIWEVD